MFFSLKFFVFVCIGAFSFFLGGCENTEQHTKTVEVSEKKSEKPFFTVKVSEKTQLHCDPQNPKSVQKWRNGEEKTVINAGFFDEKNIPLGLVQSTEKIFGKKSTYEGRFGLKKNGELWIGKSNSTVLDDFDFSLESFPLLILGNEKKELKTTEKADRRTMVGQKNGEFFWIFFTSPVSFSVAQKILLEDGFQTVLNLDGGSSTGLSSPSKEIFSVVLPCVFVQPTEGNNF